MSSRNRYLSKPDRARSLLLFKALTMAGKLFETGECHAAVLEAEMRKTLMAVGKEHDGVDKIDYATVVHAESLIAIDRVGDSAVALIAAHVGPTRLIDNMLLG